MNNDRELLQQALDALVSSRVFVTSREKIKHPEGTDWYDKRITALREALAQPEQEPVAWQNAALRIGEELSSVGPDWYYNMSPTEWLDWALEQNPKGKTSLPMREWVGLTDEEKIKLRYLVDWTVPLDIKKFADAIEAKLKEKNNG